MKILVNLKSWSGRIHKMEYLIEGFPTNKPHTHFTAICNDLIPEEKKLIGAFRCETIEKLIGEISEHQRKMNPQDCEVSFDNIDDEETYSNELLEMIEILLERSQNYKY